MSNMLIAVQITALGMGLVFGAIVLLWWMMNLLTAVTADKEPSPSPDPNTLGATNMASLNEKDLKAQAAAAAVATALAEQQLSHAHSVSEPPTTIVSAWQLGMRTRQMYQKGVSIRRRAR